MYKPSALLESTHSWRPDTKYLHALAGHNLQAMITLGATYWLLK
jgi:hypothetical protein